MEAILEGENIKIGLRTRDSMQRETFVVRPPSVTSALWKIRGTPSNGVGQAVEWVGLYWDWVGIGVYIHCEVLQS